MRRVKCRRTGRKWGLVIVVARSGKNPEHTTGSGAIYSAILIAVPVKLHPKGLRQGDVKSRVSEGTFKFRGESYANGIMEGEALLMAVSRKKAVEVCLWVTFGQASLWTVAGGR